MPENELCQAEVPDSHNPYRNVGIRKVSNGFVVNVGCKEFVFAEWQALSEGLDLYWKDPVAAEKKYCQK